jgi:hypothetical protein
VLDDVERRRLPVQPTREDAAELTVGTPHVELDESAGQLLDLPGGRRLAIAQPHDHVADPDGLARPQRQVPLQAVALVEQADHRDPLGHGGRAGGELLHGLGHVDRLVLDRRLVLAIGIFRAAGRAGREREQRHEAGAGNEAAHRDQSGVQA